MSKYESGLSKERESVFSEHYLVQYIGSLVENNGLGTIHRRRTVELSSVELDRLIEIIKRASERHVENTFKRIDGRITSRRQHEARTELAVLETITDRQFMKGPRSFIEIDDIMRKVERAIRTNNDIQCVIVGLPFKMPSILKCSSGKADLSEVGFLLQLVEFCQVLRKVVHKWIRSDWTGRVRFEVVCDGLRFSSIVGITAAEIEEYMESTGMWIRKFGLESTISLHDYRHLIKERLSGDEIRSKDKRREDVKRIYGEIIGTRVCVKTLHARIDEVIERDPDHEYENSRGRFISLFQSMLFTMRYQCIESGEGASELYKQEYLRRMRDIILLLRREGSRKDMLCTDDELNSVLTEAWAATISYIAEIRSDRDWSVDIIKLFFPDCLRWTIHSKSGQIGMNCTRSDGLSVWPWHGVSVLKESDSRLKQYSLPVSLVDSKKYLTLMAEVCGSRLPLVHIPQTGSWRSKKKIFEELELKYTRRING